jgi:hypothetical protein
VAAMAVRTTPSRNRVVVFMGQSGQKRSVQAVC